jgi:hypothetical protein
MPPRRPAPRQTAQQLPLDTRRCYDHFARRQVRARVHWYGARSRHLAPIVSAATFGSQSAS